MGSKKKGNTSHSSGGPTKEEVEQVLLAVCHSHAAAKEHKLKVGSNAKVQCEWCGKTNIAGDKKTIREHMSSKTHLMAKGDLKEEGGAMTQEPTLDADSYFGSGFSGGSLLEHPQLCGVVLDYVDLGDQLRCRLVSKKGQPHVRDSIMEAAILDLVLLFQPLSNTLAAGAEMLARKEMLERNRDDVDYLRSLRKPAWAGASRPLPGKQQRRQESATLAQSSRRLWWALDVLRRSHKDPKLVEYWVQRLKTTCFLPLPGIREESATERFLVLPPSVKPPAKRIPSKTDPKRFTSENRYIFAHLSSPRTSESVTVVQYDFLSNAPPAAKSFLKDIKKVDLLLGKDAGPTVLTSILSRRHGYHDEREDPFRKATHLTFRNLRSGEAFPNFFLSSVPTLEEIVIVGGSENNGRPSSGSKQKGVVLKVGNDFVSCTENLRSCRTLGVAQLVLDPKQSDRFFAASNLADFDFSLLNECETLPKGFMYKCPAAGGEIWQPENEKEERLHEGLKIQKKKDMEEAMTALNKVTDRHGHAHAVGARSGAVFIRDSKTATERGEQVDVDVTATVFEKEMTYDPSDDWY